MKSLSRQVDGSHYQSTEIEPSEFILKNGLGFAEGNAIKYIARHQKKGSGVSDLLKAKHYIDMLLELHYNCDPEGNEYAEGTEVEEIAPDWKYGRANFVTNEENS